MRRLILSLILFCGAVPYATSVMAQDADTQMANGILAFRETRYQDAVTAFELVLELDSDNSEAHFLLARVFFETPLKDNKRAEKEVNAALEIEPENVKYLVASMQQNREEAWSFFRKRAREIKRRELAFKILKLDSTNAFAHHELGKSYIRDFWRYRNALVFPSLIFARDKNLRRTTISPIDNLVQRQIDNIAAQNPALADLMPENDDFALQMAGFLDPNSIMMSDQFDVDALRAQGVNIQDLSGRADKAYKKAIGHLHAAIDYDPRQREVYTDLMQIFALKAEYVEALDMLQQMYVFFPEEVELWTYLGLAHYNNGNMQAAAKVFETAFEYMDEDESYAYFQLKDILPEEEKGLYEEDEIAYAARFWTSKDPRYLTPYNERKLEHYARLTYTDLLYGVPELHIRGWNTERGRILIRYGVPVADVVLIPRSTSGVGQGTNAIQGMQGDPTATTSRALQIAIQGSGWDLLEEANTLNIWDYGDFKFVFEDPFRNGEYRLFSPSASDIADGMLPWANDYTIKARETFRKIPEKYEYRAPGRQIDLPFLVVSFKNFTSDLTDVYVNYGIPVNEFDPGQDLLNVTANAGTFVVGENRDMLVERRNTIYGLKTNQVVHFEESSLWVNTQALRVPAGHQEVSVEFETVGGGTVAVQRRDVVIKDFSGDNLALSDVMLAYRIDETDDGRPVLPSDIVRDNLSIMPAPWSVFSRAQPIYLYFEVYNLTLKADGIADYEVEAVLKPKAQGSKVGKLVRGLFGGGDEGVSVTLLIQVASENDGQYLILDATTEDPGLYTLVLRVKDLVSGKKTESEQDLFLE
ncbi:MAG: tetratricopeptide repeat protein [Bacteroidetes bacterium]|nr:tetratricopeptide repeat protein [Bacteroidota bacterium]